MFWLHAFLFTRLLDYIPAWHSLSRLSLIKICITATILFYSFIAPYASWSIIVDTLYIYVSPVIALGVLSWKAGKLGFRKLCKGFPILAQVFDPPQSTVAQPGLAASIIETPDTASLLEIVSRPFTHFPLLWCFLIAISNERYIIVPALCAMIILAVRAVFVFHQVLEASVEDPKKVEDRFRKMFENMVRDVARTDRTAKEYQQTINIVLIYRSFLGFASSSASVKKMTKKLTVAIAVPTYIYVSTLCGFASYSIALFKGVHWSLADALISSIFMPIAFTNLPHIYSIQILGGLQVASLLVIGYDAIFRSIDNKMESLSVAAKGFYGLFEAENVKKAIQQLEAQNPITSSDKPPKVA